MADNYDQSGINAIFREGRLSSCVFRDNLNAAHTGIGQNVWAYQCTFLGVAGKHNVYTASSGSFTILAANCLFLDGNNGNDSIGLVAGCFADTTGNKNRTYGITYGSACVVDKGARDFRPLATSPLVGGGGYWRSLGASRTQEFFRPSGEKTLLSRHPQEFSLYQSGAGQRG